MLKQGVSSTALLFRRSVVGNKRLGGALRFSNAAAIVQESEATAAVSSFANVVVRFTRSWASSIS